MSLFNRIAVAAGKRIYRSRRLSRIVDRVLADSFQPNSVTQVYAERYFWQSCGIQPEDVRLIVDIGANEGWEAERFLVQYSNARCLMFEAHPEQYQRLQRRFRHCEERVKCYCMAVTDHVGVATFHPTTEATAGSLLPLADSIDPRYGLKADGSFSVACTTLDAFFEEHREHDGCQVDLLWIDVQGAELSVLGGAAALLPRCRAVFLEIWTGNPAYEGACTYREVRDHLEANGFIPAMLGLARGEHIGDGLWVKQRQGQFDGVPHES